jgi:hypothetical protein
MADRILIGSVAVSVVPSAETFADKLRDSLLKDADTIGSETGDILAARINEKLNDVRLRVGVDNAAADFALDDTKRKADELNGKKVDVDVDVHNASTVRSWLVSLIAGAVAIAPAFAVAGIGVGAFSALAAPALSGVVKYLQDMSTGSAKAGQAWNALTQDQKLMATEIIDLEKEFKTLSLSLQPELLQVFGAALTDIDEILPEVIPLAKAAGGAIAGLLSQIGAGLSDSQAQQFFQFVAQNLGPDIHEIGEVVVSLIHTFFSLTEAMQPLSLQLLHAVAWFANLLAVVSKNAPWLDDILVLTIALYKPLSALKDLQILSAFSWIGGAITGLRTFTVTTLAAAVAEGQGSAAAAGFAVSAAGAAVAVDGLTVSERALAIATGVLEAISPIGWVVGLTAAIAGLIIFQGHYADTTVNDTVSALSKQYQATGFNVQGYWALAYALDQARQKQAALNKSQEVAGTGEIASAPLAQARVTQYYTGTLNDLTAAEQKVLTQGNNLQANLTTLQVKYGLTSTQAIQLASTQKGAADAFKEGGDAAQGMQTKIAAFVQEQQQAHEPTNLFAKDLQAIENTALGATNQVNALTDAFNRMIAPNLNAEDAVVNMKNDLVSLNTQLVNSHGRIGDVTQAQRDSFSSFKTYIGDVNTLASDTINATGAQRKHDLQVLNQSIPFLEQLASKNKNLRGEIDDLIDIIKKIPPTEKVAVSVSGHGTWSVTGPGISGPLGTKLPFGELPSAAGRYVTGGIPGQDSVLLRAMPGEVVVPTAMVNAGAVDHLRGSIPGFAAGGLVSYSGNAVSGVSSSVSTNYPANVTIDSEALANAITAGTAISLPGGDLSAHGGSAAANQAVARALLPLFGWSVASQMPYLTALWNRESGWNQFARNPSSGAYGIPQSLPADKMASAGADWLTDPVTQERWGLGYIRGRYGSPAGAWAHEVSAGWYDAGGWAPPGASLLLNGTGAPEPVFSGSQWNSLERAIGGGGASSTYNAYFTMPDSVFEARIQNAFRAMDMANAARNRVGRRQ